MSPQLRKALAMERDRARLEAIGRIRAEALTLRARLLAIKAYRRSNNPAYVAMAVAEVLVGDYGSDTLVGVVQDGMVAGHLEGIARTQKNLSERGKGRRGLRLSSAYENALEFLRKRTGITAEQAVRLRESYGPAAAGAVQKAATAAVGKIGQALAESLQAGDGVAQGIKKLRTAFEDSGLTPGANYQLEQVFRTQTQLAYSAGRMNSLADPAVQEILWGFEYTTVGDDRVRPTHVAMDGVKAPKDDPIWQKWTPPNGYNCRCAILEVFDKGTSKPPTEPVEPDEGFAFNPGDITLDVEVPSAPVVHLVQEDEPAPTAREAATIPDAFRNWTPAASNAEWVANATKEQKDAIAAYKLSAFKQVAALDKGNFAEFYQRTAGISDPNHPAFVRAYERVVKQRQNLTEALKTVPKHEGLVYRGMKMNNADVQSLVEGQPLELNYISSFSKSEKVVRDGFLDTSSERPNPVVFRTTTSRGFDISGLIGGEGEQEVLLEKGDRFKIVSVKKDREGVTIVELEEVPVIQLQR